MTHTTRWCQRESRAGAHPQGCELSRAPTLQTLKYSVALLDFKDGIYVGKVPVIVMSGNAAAAQEYYVRRIGADDFMRKPCSRAEVFSRVERLLDLQPNALGEDAGDGAEMLPRDPA